MTQKCRVQTRALITVVYMKHTHCRSVPTIDDDDDDDDTVNGRAMEDLLRIRVQRRILIVFFSSSFFVVEKGKSSVADGSFPKASQAKQKRIPFHCV